MSMYEWLLPTTQRDIDELERLRSENAALRKLLQAGFSMVKISGINTWIIDRGPPGLCQQFPTPDAAIDAAVKAMKEEKP